MTLLLLRHGPSVPRGRSVSHSFHAPPRRSTSANRPPSDLKTPFTIHEAQEEVPDADPAPVEDIPRPIPLSDSPLRARSTRGWSVSSATPTASDTSSNPFPRPHSGAHTANTSVDLSSLTKVPSHASLASDHHHPPPAAASSTFNIDDYLSSDDDSFTAEQVPRRPRAEGEEDLLFADSGYGGMAGAGGGFQLPGLCDAFPTTTTSTATAPTIPLYDPPTANTSRRFILDTAADSENSEDEDEEEESDFIPRPARGTKRLSALCSPAPVRRRRPSFAPIEEERSGRVDVAAAVRLRKETKARRRASGMPSSVVRVNRRGRAAAPVVIRVEAPGDDEVNYADVEE